MPPIIIQQTASTWTLSPITGLDGGTISGYMSLNSNGSWFWTCSATGPNNRLSFASSGTTALPSASFNAQNQANQNLSNAASAAYALMSEVPN